tara:strand:+ start:2639 stop:2812 length:174 start_codon:yes stop_codon:yes gene_type:complete
MKKKEEIYRDEVIELIEKAMARHNRNASLISMAIGFVLLWFYADGVIRVVERLSNSG